MLLAFVRTRVCVIWLREIFSKFALQQKLKSLICLTWLELCASQSNILEMGYTMYSFSNKDNTRVYVDVFIYLSWAHTSRRAAHNAPPTSICRAHDTQLINNILTHTIFAPS